MFRETSERCGVPFARPSRAEAIPAVRPSRAEATPAVRPSRAEATPAVRPSHLGLCVSDLDASLRFYRDGFGFTPAGTVELSGSELEGLVGSLEVDGPATLTSPFITLGDLKIELLAFRDPPPRGAPSRSRNQRGLTHLSFLVDDIDVASQRLTRFGGTIVDGTRSKPGIDIVFLADPDGVGVELMAR